MEYEITCWTGDSWDYYVYFAVDSVIYVKIHEHEYMLTKNKIYELKNMLLKLNLHSISFILISQLKTIVCCVSFQMKLTILFIMNL